MLAIESEVSKRGREICGDEKQCTEKVCYNQLSMSASAQKTESYLQGGYSFSTNVYSRSNSVMRLFGLQLSNV